MAKIEKHADFLDTLHGMITKTATTAGKATGVAGKDTHYTSVKGHDEIDKNKEGHPESLVQEYEQKKLKGDESDPTKGAKSHMAKETAVKVSEDATTEVVAPVEDVKTAEAAINMPSTGKPAPAKEEAPHTITQKAANDSDVNTKLAQLGEQLLGAINDMKKQANAGMASGVPGKDTNYTSVNSKHDHVDKNKEGHPESLVQEYEQKRLSDESDPTKGAKSHVASQTAVKVSEDLDLDKEASFELGRQFARAFLSTKTASEANIYKEAGRRDFETLIAQASAELESEMPKMMAKKKEMPKMMAKAAAVVETEDLQVKQAEEAGAAAFYDLVKQAQAEEQANQIKVAFEHKINALSLEKNAAESKLATLSAKLAEREAEITKQAEEAKLDAKFAQWGGRVVDEVIARLKSEPSK